MALSDYQTAETIARSKRGTTSRSLGAKPAFTTNYVDKPSGLPGPIQKVADVGSQIGKLGVLGTKKAGSFVKNTGVDIYQAGVGGYQTAVDIVRQPIRQAHTGRVEADIDRKMAETIADYKAGRIDKTDYTQRLRDLSYSYSTVAKEAQDISQGAAPTKRAMDVVETAVNALTLGKAGMAQVGGKQVVKAGSKEAVEALVKQAATPLEQAAMKIPAVRALILRNVTQMGKREAQKLAGETAAQFLAREGRQVAVDLLIKRPIFYQSNVAQADHMFDSMIKGNYGSALADAGWLGVQMIEGGPLGVFFKGKDYLKGSLRKLAFGKGSVFDEVSRGIGDGNAAQFARFISTAEKRLGKDSEEFKEIEKTLRIIQESNLRTSGEDYRRAAQNILIHYDQHGFDRKNITPSQLYRDMRNWARADELAQEALKSGAIRGVDPSDASKYVVVRWDQTARQGLVDAYKKNGVQGVAELMNQPGVGWANNAVLVNRVEAAVNSSRNVAEFEKAMREISTAAARLKGVPKKVRDELEALGYVIAEPVGGRTTPIIEGIDDTRKLVSSAIRGDTVRSVEKRMNLAQRKTYENYDALRPEQKELVEMVDVDELMKYRQFDRSVDKPAFKLHDMTEAELRADIAKNGIQEPLILNYGAKDGIATLGEGNHRLMYAKQLGIKEVPVTVAGTKESIENLDYMKAGYAKVPGRKPDQFGYIPSNQKPSDIGIKTVTAKAGDDLPIFDPAIAPQPAVQAIAGWFQRAGLSPEASQQSATKALAESVVSNLDRSVAKDLNLTVTDERGNLVSGGRAILSKLQAYVEDKPAFMGLGGRSSVTDIRQLTPLEIDQALKIVSNRTGPGGIKLASAQGKEIYRAIVKGYQDVPLELRGLGDRVVDVLYRVNPMQKYYSRIQSALRYTYNPFFRTQERAETFLLSRAQANNLMWNKTRGELDEAVQVLDDARIFTSSLPGEAAQDVVLGRLTANVTQGQKRDLAGLALDIAKARGVDLETLATQHADEIEDALRIVVQYPRSGLLASPLARTMNLAFFPMRYNAKVTQVAATLLSKQPPSIQKAVLHSMFTMSDWLKSDEGIRWQRDNADAIQVLKWLTPVNSIESTLKLLRGSVDSPGEMGMLGGLPLGIITQILDGQGIINLNKPYVNPKTGDVLPDYIPQTAKARAAVALGDVINTLFTYPGRILGLPGKEQQVRKIVETFIDTNGKDFDKQINMEELTPLQQNWVRVLKGDTSKEAIDELYNSPAPGQFNWYTLPPMDLPIRTPGGPAPDVQRRTGLPSKKKASGPKPKKVAVPIST